MKQALVEVERGGSGVVEKRETVGDNVVENREKVGISRRVAWVGGIIKLRKRKISLSWDAARERQGSSI